MNTYLSLTIFILCYIGIILFHNKKIYAGLLAVFFLLALRIVSFIDIPRAIDWNVLFIITGTSLLICPFIESKIPQFIADKIIQHLHRADIILISICLFSGFISIFLENVSTVLIVAPIALELTRRMEISPVDTIISVAISSKRCLSTYIRAWYSLLDPVKGERRLHAVCSERSAIRT